MLIRLCPRGNIPALLLWTISSSGCTSIDQRYREARERGQEEAFRLERQADFAWRVSGLTVDSFNVRHGRYPGLGSQEGPETRGDLLRWLSIRDIERELAAVTVTSSFAHSADKLLDGEDGLGTDYRSFLAIVTRRLREQGFRRVVVLLSPASPGQVSVLQDSSKP